MSQYEILISWYPNNYFGPSNKLKKTEVYKTITLNEEKYKFKALIS